MSRRAHPAAARMKVSAGERVNSRDMAEPDRRRERVNRRDMAEADRRREGVNTAGSRGTSRQCRMTSSFSACRPSLRECT